MRQFDAALVGGPAHRDYLVDLGMPPDRIALGYNAVDNDYFATRANFWRDSPTGRSGLPDAPYFLTVCRFASEKNLVRLIRAFARYREQCNPLTAWDLVLCGDGPQAAEVQDAIGRTGSESVIHRPGFLQADSLSRYYAHAAAFVLPSLSEPWGLVVNEAAASGLPLLVSTRAGCSATLVPDPEGTTGGRFDPLDVEVMTTKLAWMAALGGEDRRAMGLRAAQVVSSWGPDRFARGAVESLEFARAATEATRPLFIDPDEKEINRCSERTAGPMRVRPSSQPNVVAPARLDPLAPAGVSIFAMGWTGCATAEWSRVFWE